MYKPNFIKAEDKLMLAKCMSLDVLYVNKMHHIYINHTVKEM